MSITFKSDGTIEGRNIGSYSQSNDSGIIRFKSSYGYDYLYSDNYYIAFDDIINSARDSEKEFFKHVPTFRKDDSLKSIIYCKGLNVTSNFIDRNSTFSESFEDPYLDFETVTFKGLKKNGVDLKYIKMPENSTYRNRVGSNPNHTFYYSYGHNTGTTQGSGGHILYKLYEAAPKGCMISATQLYNETDSYDLINEDCILYDYTYDEYDDTDDIEVRFHLQRADLGINYSLYMDDELTESGLLYNDSRGAYPINRVGISLCAGSGGGGALYRRTSHGSTTYYSGGGGGGGGSAICILDLENYSYDIYVGAGGAGSGSYSTNGHAGQDSYIVRSDNTIIVTCKGGDGGKSASSQSATTGVGGSGGLGGGVNFSSPTPNEIITYAEGGKGGTGGWWYSDSSNAEGASGDNSTMSAHLYGYSGYIDLISGPGGGTRRPRTTGSVFGGGPGSAAHRCPQTTPETQYYNNSKGGGNGGWYSGANHYGFSGDGGGFTLYY